MIIISYYKQETGSSGEEEAVKFLVKNNYNIIKRNFRCSFGEIDIIAKDKEKNEIVFIEVKSRNNQTYGKPAEAVNFYKRKHIIKTIRYFLHINKLKDEFVRIDVIEVFFRKESKESSVVINHIKQAFY